MPPPALLAAALCLLSLVQLHVPLAVSALPVPDLDLAAWNRAYQLKLESIPKGNLRFSLPYSCKRSGFNSNPVAAQLNACFYNINKDNTISYWQKLPGDARENTNCYCYALNAMNDGYCSPGTSNGTDKLWDNDAPVTCALIKAAMVADGGVEISRVTALSGQPSSGHYTAMLTRPNVRTNCTPHCYESDYHAVRKDSNGLWSWKEPSGPAGNTDVFGDVIRDPEASVINGHYTVCAYFHVQPDKMVIGGGFGERTLQDRVDLYRKDGDKLGMKVSLTALDYNATTDAAYDRSEQRLINEDIEYLKNSSRNGPAGPTTHPPLGQVVNGCA